MTTWGEIGWPTLVILSIHIVYVFFWLRFRAGQSSWGAPGRLKPMKIKWRDYCFRVKIYQADLGDAAGGVGESGISTLTDGDSTIRWVEDAQ